MGDPEKSAAGAEDVDEADAPGEAAAPRQRVLQPIGAAAFVLIGGAEILSGIGFGFGSVDQPGAGFWPAVLGGALVLSAVAFLVFVRDRKEGAFGAELWNALIVVGSIVVFVLLFEHVHFAVASVVLLTGCQLAAGARRWLPIVLTSVVGTAAAWILFFVVLGVTTPL